MELDIVRVQSKSRKCSQSKKHSKSRRHSHSRKRSTSCHRRGSSQRRLKSRARDAWEPGSRMKRPGVWPANQPREVPDQPLDSQPLKDATNQTARSAEGPAPQQQITNFLKLKEEVVKHPQKYIRRQILAIGQTLGADHEAVKSLSAFGDQACWFAA